jgi:hypothetical protein
MARTRWVRPLVIASFVALGGLLAVPGGASRLWATSYEQPRQQKPTMQAPGTATPATAPPQPTPMQTTLTPTTVDDYAQYVQNRLQAEAMQVKTAGTADVRLTIGRDGAVRQTHDARVAALCRQHRVSELWTADRVFGRFPGLNVRNPSIG